MQCIVYIYIYCIHTVCSTYVCVWDMGALRSIRYRQTGWWLTEHSYNDDAPTYRWLIAHTDLQRGYINAVFYTNLLYAIYIKNAIDVFILHDRQTRILRRCMQGIIPHRHHTYIHIYIIYIYIYIYSVHCTTTFSFNPA